MTPFSVTSRFIVGPTGLEEHRLPLGRPEADEVVVEVAGSAVGTQPGAEIAGRVVAAGSEAGEWLGRRVVVPRHLPCGVCAPCRRGRVLACLAPVPRGACALHEVVPARCLLSVEPPLWQGEGELWRLAALADAWSVPYQALLSLELSSDDICLVIGAGVRGRAAVALARAKGAQVVVIDGDVRRRRLAEQAGAVVALDGDGLERETVRGVLAAARGAANLSGLVMIETTAGARGRRATLELAERGSRVALLGGAPGGGSIAPWDSLVELGVLLVGVDACHPDLLPELAVLLAGLGPVFASSVTARPFVELAVLLQAVRRGEILELPILVPPACPSG